MGTNPRHKLSSQIFQLNFFFIFFSQKLFFPFFSFSSFTASEILKMRLIVVIYMLATALTTASACCRRMLRATITATPPHAIDSAAVWGKKQMCPCKTWVQGFSIWQDDSVTKPRGLTKIEFICGTQPAHGRSFSRIGSGEARGKHVLQNTFT